MRVHTLRTELPHTRVPCFAFADIGPMSYPCKSEQLRRYQRQMLRVCFLHLRRNRFRAADEDSQGQKYCLCFQDFTSGFGKMQRNSARRACWGGPFERRSMLVLHDMCIATQTTSCRLFRTLVGLHQTAAEEQGREHHGIPGCKSDPEPTFRTYPF